MWLFLGIFSALSLGIYDVCKKLSLQKNAVIPVLFISIVISSTLLMPFFFLSKMVPETIQNSIFFVPDISWEAHLLILLKSVIVLSSWLFGYFAMKNLPITIASPIKATQPMWIVLGAVLIFGEKLSIFQWIGVLIALVSFWSFSVSGKKEGISFKSNKYLWFIILATLTGAISGLYDKHLLKQFDHMAVQVYYTFYQAIMMAFVTWLLWYPTRKKTTPFQWRWSIVFISLFLVMADFAYFYALSMPNSLISVISTLRRSGVIVPFIFGAIFMHEKNMKQKTLSLLSVIIGTLLLFFES